MTLEEAKTKAYDKYMSRVHQMRDLIEDPTQLRSCGYKTLEEALTKLTLNCCKEVDAIFAQYERDNP